MNNMEDKLWEYIDGTCSEQEKDAITALIESDEKWRSAFNDLLQVSNELSALTLDEPPMAFTYNVIESIRKQEAAKPLKTKVNTYIIGAVAGIILLCLGAILLMAFDAKVESVGNTSYFKLPDLSIITNSVAVKAFVYFDIMLLLFFADRVIRRRNFRDINRSV